MKLPIARINKSSFLDFPGVVSAVLFTQGCSLRCNYCHSPNLVLPGQFRRPVQMQSVLSFLLDKRHLLEGVVIKGGEPTMHEDLPGFMKLIKSMGYKIKLDTNGMHPDVLKNVLQMKTVHYIVLDIKTAFYKYEALTAIPNSDQLIRQSIDLIIESGIRHQFRTTIVSPWVSRDDVLALAEYLKGADAYKLQPLKFPLKNTIGAVSPIQITEKEISLLQAEVDRIFYPHLIRKQSEVRG